MTTSIIITMVIIIVIITITSVIIVTNINVIVISCIIISSLNIGIRISAGAVGGVQEVRQRQLLLDSQLYA